MNVINASTPKALRIQVAKEPRFSKVIWGCDDGDDPYGSPDYEEGEVHEVHRGGLEPIPLPIDSVTATGVSEGQRGGGRPRGFGVQMRRAGSAL